jgi:hypothetical protein
MTRDDIMNRVAEITKVNAWGDEYDQTDARYHINQVLIGFVNNDYDQLEVAAALALAIHTLDTIHRHTTHTEMEIRDLLHNSRKVVLTKETK